MNPELARKRLRLLPAGRILLRALAVAYGIGVWARNTLYNLGLLRARRLQARIICIGNLTTGGTGKTPAVLLAAITLRKNQIKTAILTRGYKRQEGKNKVQVLLTARDIDWKMSGDEPWMMHRALKGFEVPILVHPNRYLAGQAALRNYRCQALLLDDGFQHRGLHRDLDIVLINALDPFGGESLLPDGNLREPLSALKRAGLAVITHADQVEASAIADIREKIGMIHPDLRVIESAHRSDFLFDLKQDRRRRLEYLKGRPVTCLSGIGNPLSFEDLLRASGAETAQVWRFPDHHPFSQEELQSIENVREDRTLVMTLKDYPRLPPRWKNILSGDVLALSIKLEITKGRKIWEELICDGSGNGHG